MTLFLIAMVGLLLAIFSQYSLELAGDAARLRRDVQVKWARASLQKYGIENAVERLKSVENGVRLRSWHQTVSLNAMEFDFWVVDESAKLNLNAASRFMSEEALTELTRQMIQAGVSIRLDPIPTEFQNARTDPFESWGQVIQLPAGERDPARTIFDATQDVTCWGTRLNWRLADEETLREAVKMVAGGSAAAQLVEASRNPESKLGEAIGLVARNERQRIQLSRLLDERSSTYGIWVRQSVPLGTTTLTIRESVTNSVERTVSFCW